MVLHFSYSLFEIEKNLLITTLKCSAFKTEVFNEIGFKKKSNMNTNDIAP